MGYTETSSFPKMGDDGMASLVNMSGQRSPYTKPVQRQGPTTPDLGGGGAGGLSHTMIHEANGPACTILASRGWATDYAATGRAMRTVPSSVGNRDFWDARAQSNEGQVI
jgi:hypothetical protein